MGTARVYLGGRRGLPLRKIGTALMLGVVPVALTMPGGDIALGQPSTGTGAQIPLFTAINLHPPGFTTSYALGVSGGQQVGVGITSEYRIHALLWRGSAASAVELTPSRWNAEVHGVCGGQQVGYGDGPGTAGTAHALLWHGSAGSMVDLNPKGFTGSAAFGISGGQQVGDGNGHALLWRGSAASVVDLHPDGFTFSQALATSGAEQVGFGNVSRGGTDYHHALLWHDSAASVVDLHPRGFRSTEADGTSGGQQVGYGDGPATGAYPGTGPITFHDHALLWRGSAASVVDLNPPGFISSSAQAANGEEQVGSGWGPATHDEGHALLWRGSAASVVDLHTFLPPGFVRSSALAVDAAGDVVGSASTVTGPAGDDYAFLWKRNLPEAGPVRQKNITRC